LYSVYAFQYQDVTSYLDEFHALVNGASVFIYPEKMDKVPITLKLVPYRGWNEVSTGLEQTSKWELRAPDVDILIDSPIEVGNHEVRSFIVDKVEHAVSLFGSAPVDKDKLVADIRKIVESEILIFRSIPYSRYVFLINFTDETGGGLEHLNSTVCFVPRMRVVPREEYNLMMGLFSHEFFHTWNVKRLRPMGLGPFNYLSETYTKSLWIAEGITSYYDDLVLRRAGIYTVPEYLDAFAINVNAMKTFPGRRRQSAQEASFDAWIKLYKPNTDSPNAIMSYYTQGAVIGWMLDLQIRKNTNHKKNLDDVMRKIYQDTFAKDGRAYGDEEFEATVSTIGGKEGIEEIFNSRVRGREEVDFEKYLGYVGLKIDPKISQEQKGFLGVRLGSEGGKTVVKARLAESPAETMGLSVNDEIIGVDGYRLGGDKIPFYISNSRVGSQIVLLVARHGIFAELKGELVKKPSFEFKITPLEKATEEQSSLFRDWLGAEWLSEIKYPEYARSPDRKTGLDFV
jgi:predicted metalloprotease with PDZ domain